MVAAADKVNTVDFDGLQRQTKKPPNHERPEMESDKRMSVEMGHRSVWVRACVCEVGGVKG